MNRSMLLGLFMMAFIAVWGVSSSQAQESRTNQMVLGVDLGPALGTIDGSAFTLALSGDYYSSRNLSFGPLVQLAFTGDLSQVGISGQLKYTFDVPHGSPFRPNFQVGLGFVHADHENWNGAGTGSRSDTSYLIPVGLGFEYKVQAGILLSTTALLNFSNLNNAAGGFWQDSLSLLLGIRFLL